MRLSCGIVPGPRAPETAALAEELGYHRAWFYDSPALYGDVWVAIARSLMQGSSIVIMDEPTAALGVEETARVLGLIQDLHAHGVSVIVVSHNLHHVFSIADRITVLRGGRCVGVRRRVETTSEEIVTLITGAELVTPHAGPLTG